MKPKVILSLIMVLLLVFLLPGCFGGRQSPLQQANPPSPVTEEGATRTIEITDPEEIQYLWSHYLYDGIPTVLNGEFDDPAEMKDQGYLVHFALVRLVKDGDVPSNPSDAQDTREIEIPSVKQVEQKIKEYFNIDVPVDPEKLIKQSYILSDDGRMIKIPSEEVGYEEKPWGFTIDKILYDPAKGEYRVAMDHIANLKTGRVDYTIQVTLKERGKRDLYYGSVKREYKEQKVVELLGEYTPLRAEDFGAEVVENVTPISIYGFDVGRNLLLIASSDRMDTITLYNPENHQMERRLELPISSGSLFRGIRKLPDRLIFKMNDSFFVTDLNLTRMGEAATKLPDSVRKVLANPQYLSEYDVSQDLKKIVYTDRSGLYLHDLESGKTTKLSSHIPVKSTLLDTSYIRTPYYSKDDQMIIAKLSGYEEDYGLLVLPLDQPAKRYIERKISRFESMDETNVMFPIPSIEYIDVEEVSVGQRGEGRRTFAIRMVDLNKKDLSSAVEKSVLRKVDFQDEWNQQPWNLNTEGIPRYNGKYMAYVASDREEGIVYPDERIYHLVRINLETMKAETVLSVKAGVPSIRALTGDGRILFSYAFEREQGLAITGK